MTSTDHTCDDECRPPCDHCSDCGHSVEDCHHAYCCPARGEHTDDCIRDARRTLATVGEEHSRAASDSTDRQNGKGSALDLNEIAELFTPDPPCPEHGICGDHQDDRCEPGTCTGRCADDCCGDPDACCGCTCEPPTDYELAHGIDMPAADCGVHGTDGCIAARLVADGDCCLDTGARASDVCGTPCWLVETPDTKPGSVEWFAEERRRRDAARDKAAARVAAVSAGLNQRLAAADTARCRRYRQSHGHWGIGIAHSPGGWHLSLGPWCWTTEAV